MLLFVFIGMLNDVFTVFKWFQGYPMEYANKQQRFHWQYADGEIEHLARLTGLERVKLSICTVKDLLPDDDARIFTQVRYCDCFYCCYSAVCYMCFILFILFFSVIFFCLFYWDIGWRVVEFCGLTRWAH